MTSERNNGHLGEEEIIAYYYGEASQEEIRRVERHLPGCADCSNLLAQHEKVGIAFRDAYPPVSAPPLPQASPRRAGWSKSPAFVVAAATACFVLVSVIGLMGRIRTVQAEYHVDPPPQATSVAVVTMVQIPYPEGVDRGLVERSLRIEPDVPVITQWQGDVLTVRPQTQLAPGTRYSVVAPAVSVAVDPLAAIGHLVKPDTSLTTPREVTSFTTAGTPVVMTVAVASQTASAAATTAATAALATRPPVPETATPGPVALASPIITPTGGASVTLVVTPAATANSTATPAPLVETLQLRKQDHVSGLVLYDDLNGFAYLLMDSGVYRVLELSRPATPPALSIPTMVATATLASTPAGSATAPPVIVATPDGEQPAVDATAVIATVEPTATATPTAAAPAPPAGRQWADIIIELIGEPVGPAENVVVQLRRQGETLTIAVGDTGWVLQGDGSWQILGVEPVITVAPTPGSQPALLLETPTPPKQTVTATATAAATAGTATPTAAKGLRPPDS